MLVTRPAGRVRGRTGQRLDAAEFAEFYAASFGRLTSQLAAMTGDRAEAQDAVQEAFIRAWQHRGRLDRAASPETWVRTTAWRIAMTRWRRTQSGLRLIGLRAGAGRPAQSVAGPTADRVAFESALRQLPAEQRRALVLYYVCDLTVAQIAAETGAPDGTVKARLARGRAAMAPHLNDNMLSGTPTADKEVRDA
jgi:RNA polymerase sigma-70 factor, ECF subfamily